MSPDPALLAGIGMLSGVVASLLGLGGGLLMTPFLAALGLPLAVVVPTSACVIAGAALATSLLNWRQRSGAEPRLAVVTTLAMLPAVELSVWCNRWLRGLAPGLSDAVLSGLFVALMAWSLLMVMLPGPPPAASDPWPGPGLRLGGGRRCSLLRLLAGGSVAGFSGGLLGLGGGRILVPLFSGPLGLAIKSAIATSSLCILLSGLYSAVSFAAKGLVDVHAATWLLVGALPGVCLGTLGLKRADPALLRRTYVELSVAAMVAVVLSACGWRHTALVILVAGCAWVGWAALRSVLRPTRIPEGAR